MSDQHANDSDNTRVALVSMPWSIYNRPSIQLGVLKSYLLQQDPRIEVDCLHHYLQIARALGPEIYHWHTLSGWAGEALVIVAGHRKADAQLPDQGIVAEVLVDHQGIVEVAGTIPQQRIQNMAAVKLADGDQI